MAVRDDWNGWSSDVCGPLAGGFAAPADGSDLRAVTRALMVGGAGDAAVELASGDVLVLPGLIPGAVYPVRIRRVFAAGTTATGLVGLV